MTKFVNFANQKLQERNASLDLSRATKILQNDLDRQILSRDNDLKENHDVYKAPGDENSYQQLNPIQQLNPLLMNPNAENVHLGSAHQSAVSLSNLNRGRGVNRQAMMSALFGVNPEDKNYLLPAKEFTDQELWQGYLDYHVELQKQFLLQQEQVIRDVTDLATLFDEGANLTEKFSLKDTDFCTRGENSMMIIDDKKVEAELEKRAGNYYPEGIDLPNILREGDVQIKDFNAFKTAEIIKGILHNPESSQSEKNVALSYLWIRAVKEVNDSKTAFALSRDKEGDFVQMLNGNKTDEEIKSFFEEKKQESLEALKQIASPDDVLSQGKLALIKDKLEFDKFSSKPDLLLLAARNKYLEALDILLGGNIDVNHTNQDGATALMFAAQNGHLGVVEKLLEKGSNVTQPRKDGLAALMLAAQNGHLGVVEKLLEKGSDVNQTKKNGATALMIATYYGHSGLVEQLLAAPGIEVNKADENGATALIVAAQNGQLEVVKKLLKYPGIDVNEVHKSGVNALMFAAQNGHLEVVKELLKHPGIVVDQKTKKGDATALMLAAHNGRQEVVDAIVKKLCIDGVDPQKISYLPEGRPKIFNDANKISNFANQICSFIATDLNLSAACHHDKLKPLVRKSLFKEIFADENKENVNHITNRFAQKEVAKQVAEEVAEAIEEKLQSSRKVKPSKSVLSLVLSSELKTLDTEDEEVKELVGAPIKELVKKVALEPDTNPMHSQGMAAIGGRANNNRELS